MKKILLLSLIVLIAQGMMAQKSKRKSDKVMQVELNKKMDEFYNHDYKIMVLDIINEKNVYFYKCICIPKSKNKEEKYFLLMIWKTKNGLQIKTRVNEKRVKRIFDESLNSPIVTFTVGKYPLHRYFNIDSLKTNSRDINEFIGSVIIKGKFEEIR